MGLCASQAHALSLGRITVLSPLGAPLLAEVEILDINADEASSLKAKAASSDAFKAAGLEYNPALAALVITLERRQNDRSYLRISSDRSIVDPFLDLMLEASWSSGRIVRDYTLLFDPPNSQPNQVNISSAPQLSSIPAQIRPSAAPPTLTRNEIVTSDKSRAPALPRASDKKTALFSEKSDGSVKSVAVKPGDTAGGIAASLINPSISLDQMLVAMLRKNPEAFVEGNINRIRAGAVVNIPVAEEVQATPTAEAKQIIFTQSQDFNEFRRKLATNAPFTTKPVADRQANGAIQSKVDDKKAGTSLPDKLTLSQGSVSNKSSEIAIAKERQAKEVAKKTDEAAKNISELTKLVAATAPVVIDPTLQAATSAPSTNVPLSTNETLAAPIAKPGDSTISNAGAITPANDASAPQVTLSVPAKNLPTPVTTPTPTPAPAPASESSLIDELLDDPLVPAAAGGLIALLIGLGLYRHKKRKDSDQPVTEFAEIPNQHDSFFGASGGQQVDTLDSSMAGSSMLYTPSQLESADDVDPVAEADVYLAYGRDIQAEEILKEALKMHPDRVAIHQKLLEIYAKRRDLKSFQSISKQILKVAGVDSLEWGRVCELGRGIDPVNELYQSPIDSMSASDSYESGKSAGIDLDLDFSLDNAIPKNPNDEMESFTNKHIAGIRESTSHDPDLNFDFNLSEPAADNIQHSAANTSWDDIQNLAFDTTENNELRAQVSESHEFESDSSDNVPTAASPLANLSHPDNSGLLQFDLGSLSLDLGPTTEQSPDHEEDPLSTKLSLAAEFGSIGDLDGARNLIEEVIAEASGEMKAKAQHALSQLR